MHSSQSVNTSYSKENQRLHGWITTILPTYPLQFRAYSNELQRLSQEELEQTIFHQQTVSQCYSRSVLCQPTQMLTFRHIMTRLSNKTLHLFENELDIRDIITLAPSNRTEGGLQDVERKREPSAGLVGESKAVGGRPEGNSTRDFGVEWIRLALACMEP